MTIEFPEDEGREFEVGQEIPKDLQTLCMENEYGQYSLRFQRFLYIVNKKYIIEPLASRTAKKLPRLSFVRYIPEVSVEWDGKKIHYYQHKAKEWWPTPKEMITLPSQWLFFYMFLMLKLIIMLLLMTFFLIRKILLIILKLLHR